MEHKKIRVAITQGDTNGIGYEVILKALEDPMMLDLCTPIIYGSPKVASFHRKAMELETQFQVINDADEANPNRVNLLAAFDDDAASNVTLRIILIQDAINRLTEYDPELLPVAEAIDPLSVINASSVAELKEQMGQAKDQITEARQALIELIY